MRKLTINARFEETLAGWSQRRVALGAINKGLQASGPAIRVQAGNNVVPLPFNPLVRPGRPKIRAATPAPAPRAPARNPKGGAPFNPLARSPRKAPRLALPPPAPLPDTQPGSEAPPAPPADSNLPPLTFEPPSLNTPPASGGGGGSGSGGSGSGGGGSGGVVPDVGAEPATEIAETAADLAPVIIAPTPPPPPPSSNNQVLLYAGLAALAYFVFIRKV